MTTSTPTPVANVLDKAIAIAIDKTSFGLVRKADLARVDVKAHVDEDKADPDKRFLNLTKKLLNSPEYRAIERCDEHNKARLMALALPSSFKASVYLVPHPAVDEAVDIIEGWIAQRQVLVDQFASYPARVDEMRVPLGPLFNARNYPAVKDVVARFSLTYRFLELGVPGQLQSISAKAYQRACERAEADVKALTDDVRIVLREAAAGLFAHLADLLTTTDKGRKRSLRTNALDKVKGFIETFDIRNLTDDAELKAVMAKAKAALDGVDVETLRKDDSFRDMVKADLGAINAALSTMVVAKSRAIKFADDDGDEATPEAASAA